MPPTTLAALTNLTSTAPYPLIFNNPRTVTQILTPFLVLWIGTVIIAQLALTKARNLSPKARGNSLLLFAFLPTYPVASLICRAVLYSKIALTEPWPKARVVYFKYLISALLGLKASVNTQSSSDDAEKELPVGNEDKPSPSRPSTLNLSLPIPGADRKSPVGIEVKSPPSTKTKSIELLANDFEDYTLVPCLCRPTKTFCSRYTRPFFSTLLTLTFVTYICTTTLFLYLERCSLSWQDMARQTLIPSAEGTVTIDAKGFETISVLDDLKAVFALGGCVVAVQAFLLRVAGWQWVFRGEGAGSAEKREHEKEESKQEGSEESDHHLRSLRISGLDVRIELPLAMLIYMVLTRHSWLRLAKGWDSWPIVTWIVVGATGFNFLSQYIWWTTNWRAEKLQERPRMFVFGFLFVAEFVFVHTWNDMWDMRACVAGGKCPQKLFMWKSEWSNTLWSY